MRILIPLGAALVLGLVVWFRPGAAVVSGPSPSAWQTAQPLAHASSRLGSGPALVYVAGEVRAPGVYALAPGARVRDAVAKAGGLRGSADAVAVNLAAHVADGDEIVVPPLGAASARATRAVSRKAGRTGGARRARKRGRHHGAAAPPALVDLNRADAETLATLPGVGPGLAERIVAFRDANGAFASPDELLDVAGFTERRLDAVLPFVVAR